MITVGFNADWMHPPSDEFYAPKTAKGNVPVLIHLIVERAHIKIRPIFAFWFARAYH